MPNGSEESGVAAQVTMPGYKMPNGADAGTEEGFRAWVDSVHPAFVASSLAGRLILEEYDRITSVYGISEAKLIEVFDVKEGHAVQFVQAVKRVRRTLGHTDDVTTPSAGTYHKKRTQAPKIPTAAEDPNRLWCRRPGRRGS